MNKKIKITQKRGQPSYRQSQNPQIRFWQKCFGYISNARIIQVSKLVDIINLYDFSDQVEES